MGSWTKTSLTECKFDVELFSLLVDSQFIFLTGFEKSRDIHREAEVSTPVESCLLSIDKYSGFIIDSIEIQKNILSIPIGWYIELSGKPRVQGKVTLDA